MKGMSQITVRMQDRVLALLAELARGAGLETADYVSSVLGEHAVLSGAATAETRRQLQGEIAVKRAAADLARKLSPPSAFDGHVTLKVFQAIRTDPVLRASYLDAIGGGDAFARRNPLKARINKAIGSTVKAAIGAASRDAEGAAVKVEVGSELCFSYTLLFAPDPKAFRKPVRTASQAA